MREQPTDRATVRVIEGGIDRLPTVRQAGDTLGVYRATVYALCERGELAHVRIVNAIRVRREDLEAFVAARTRGRGG